MKSKGALWANAYVFDEVSIIGDHSEAGQFGVIDTDAISSIGGSLVSYFATDSYTLAVSGISYIGQAYIGIVGDEI